MPCWKAYGIQVLDGSLIQSWFEATPELEFTVPIVPKWAEFRLLAKRWLRVAEAGWEEERNMVSADTGSGLTGVKALVWSRLGQIGLSGEGQAHWPRQV